MIKMHIHSQQQSRFQSPKAPVSQPQKSKESNLLLEEDEQLAVSEPTQISSPSPSVYTLEDLLDSMKKYRFYITLIVIICASVILSVDWEQTNGEGDFGVDLEVVGHHEREEIGGSDQIRREEEEEGKQSQYVGQKEEDDEYDGLEVIREQNDDKNQHSEQTMTTSSYKIYPKSPKQYQEKVSAIESALKSHLPITSPKYKQTPSSQSFPSTKLLTKPINQWMQKAIKQIKNTQILQKRMGIEKYGPFQELPFCVFVRLDQRNGKQVNEDIVRSVFMVDYANFITIFIGQEKNGLSEQALRTMMQKQVPDSKKPHKLFYKISLLAPAYFEYRYLADQLCVPKSFLLFPSSALSPSCLQTLNSHHQLYPSYVTFSESRMYYFVHSVAMRMFDLLGLNDFGGGRSGGIFGRNDGDKFWVLGLVELGKNMCGKLEIGSIYEENLMGKTKNWLTAVSKTDKTSYTRLPYQPLLYLSQTSQINLKQHEQYLAKIRNPAVNSEVLQKTEITRGQMLQVIDQQNSRYLPTQSSVNRRYQIQKTRYYGQYDRTRSKVLAERQFCAVVFTKEKASAQIKRRYLRGLASLLTQKYTNLSIILFDNNPQLQSPIQNLLNETNFNPKKFNHIQNPNTASKSPLFKIIRSAFQYCEKDDLVVIMDADFQIISDGFLEFVNRVFGGNRDVWALYTNYKTDKHNFGYPYRIESEHEYRNFDSRVTNLQFLSPLPIVENKLLRNIPLAYLQDQNKQWLTTNWHKALQHSLIQLASPIHVEYIPEIEFQISEANVGNYWIHQQTEIEKYITGMTLLKPLASLNQNLNQNQIVIQESIKKVLGQDGKSSNL